MFSKLFNWNRGLVLLFLWPRNARSVLAASSLCEYNRSLGSRRSQRHRGAAQWSTWSVISSTNLLIRSILVIMAGTGPLRQYMPAAEAENLPFDSCIFFLTCCNTYVVDLVFVSTNVRLLFFWDWILGRKNNYICYPKDRNMLWQLTRTEAAAIVTVILVQLSMPPILFLSFSNLFGEPPISDHLNHEGRGGGGALSQLLVKISPNIIWFGTVHNHDATHYNIRVDTDLKLVATIATGGRVNFFPVV